MPKDKEVDGGTAGVGPREARERTLAALPKLSREALSSSPLLNCYEVLFDLWYEDQIPSTYYDRATAALAKAQGEQGCASARGKTLAGESDGVPQLRAETAATRGSSARTEILTWQDRMRPSYSITLWEWPGDPKYTIEHLHDGVTLHDLTRSTDVQGQPLTTKNQACKTFELELLRHIHPV